MTGGEQQPSATADAKDGDERRGVGRLDAFFELSARGSTWAAEIRGGLVTFIAMAYIIVLNPIILSGSADVSGNRLDFAQVSAVTSLAAGLMTIVFGVIARLPFAFAAGLGINSFLATTVVGSLTWPEAMGLVVIDGLIIVVLAATGLRRLVFDAVPMELKLAITAGIGLFILFIGLVDAGFIGSTGVASPPVGLGSGGTGSIAAVPTVIFVITLLATGILVVRKVRGGILIGLVAGTVLAMIVEAIWHLGSATETPGGWSLSVPTLAGSPFSLPDLSLVGAFSFDSFGRIGVLAAVMLVFTLVFANFFDAMGTFTGLSREAGLSDEQGNFPRLRSALIVEGAGAAVGGSASASSNTVFIESAAGIEEGARTGAANLVTGVLFLAAMFVTPLASVVPTEVAAAALVIVGVMMVSQLRHIDLSEFSVGLPVVLTVATMPLSYSIANGIGVGFISWVVVRSATGKWREVSPLLWIVAAGFLVYFARGWVESLIGM
ncbi:MFS transporter [Mycolicibacterium agri]|uniref:MFS transporter n=1 Tax=Mycolicibacterium agri TaxID=36811 RepID=A0A2A7NGZ8_MYCAG|nr:NCS2 family permease [Mycolicibacterium agri]PEG43086.1 MFS transporter [Mycolicibacterium agri]GFG54531.1 xanthine/uracil permease [Mycolicibacterium agri]